MNTDMAAKRSSTGQVLNLYKNLGETPRERLERLRGRERHLEHEVLSYAGRLDPMAEGVLLCLVGSANKRREAYLELSKEYMLDVLFGFSTDTYDILGRVMETGDGGGIARERVVKVLNQFRGELSQQYPPFSSKVVEGKSLFEWARSNSLSSLVLPSRSVTVYEIALEGLYKVEEPDLLAYIQENIGKVNGDFRQEEVLRLWERHLKASGKRNFPCATVKISCSSGTYARSISHGLGAELGIPALTLHLLRTKVGDFSVDKSLR
ncbi:MAG: tRNA pseudouridine synthase B [Candidatus Adlerbacteria bacterium GW2011_GWA1_54_10]|uniref:tRNA pseudouridine(55) synthase n=1 Tax=Candidatus Adlerbacteria bacterium GW2011_GWA1_54_10 TaxID=1618605 RepID=A0A0G2A3Q3_9BACT|nr:MAG: tRNA pseudouridine synthase B [Candidatus Adlerbacteria bacterium GW2011_GWA1_54_10]